MFEYIKREYISYKFWIGLEIGYSFDTSLFALTSALFL